MLIEFKMFIRKTFSLVAHSVGFIKNIFTRKMRTLDSLILMYHRIVSTEEAKLVEPGMYVNRSSFEMHLKLVTEHMHPVALRTKARKKKEDIEPINDKAACVITFDDGWRDFYQYVFPLLRKYSIPATVFLPTSFIGTKKIFWTDRLMNVSRAVLQRNHSKKEIPGSWLTISRRVYDFFCSGPQEYYRAIHFLKTYKYSLIESALNDLELFLDIDLDDKERTFLSWEEVLEMKDSGLVDFGSHTHNHAILTTLARDEICFELEKSKEILLAHGAVDSEFIPFCYPNGNFNVEIAKMVKEAGYSLAVTTKRGWNTKDAHLFTLNRIGMHNDISYTPSLFLARVAGLL